MLDKEKFKMYNGNKSQLQYATGRKEANCMQEIKYAMSIEEASDYTGIGRNTIRKLIEWEKLPVLRIGRKIVIRRDALERFIAINEGCNLRIRNETKAVTN